VTVLNFETLVAGSIWLALGLTTYVLYRRHLGLSLTETHKIALPKPAVEHEVEYESILVAFKDANYSSEVVVTAVRLAARRRRGIHVLVTITVPPNVPIDAQMPSSSPAPRPRSTQRMYEEGGASPDTGRKSVQAKPADESSKRPRTCAPARS
jgi:basic amino acid/polyamine antiporter, APA family